MQHFVRPVATLQGALLELSFKSLATVLPSYEPEQQPATWNHVHKGAVAAHIAWCVIIISSLNGLKIPSRRGILYLVLET